MSAAEINYHITQTYAREALDYYVEAPWVVDGLLTKESFVGTIYDPACGSGNIPRQAMSHGWRVSYSDIVDRGYPGTVVHDFLGDRRPPFRVDNIVTNPPFKHAEDFVRRGMQIATHKVALLLRLEFLATVRRHDLFTREHRPRRVIVLSRRPSMPPGEKLFAKNMTHETIRATNGRVEYCWIIWAHGHRGETSITWVNPQDDKNRSNSRR